MLYRTLHPHSLFFPFPFHSLSSSLISTTTTTTPSPSQVGKEMECVKNGNLENATGEEFFVDQLLNLNDESISQVEEQEGKNDPFCEQEQEASSTDKEALNCKNYNKLSDSFLSPPLETDRHKDDFGSVLSVPAEEADLEWLSQFVEESFSQASSTPFPNGFLPEKPKSWSNSKPKFGTGTGAEAGYPFTSPALKARRSKRARTGGRVWTTSSMYDSSPPQSSSPTSSSTTSFSCPSSPTRETSSARPKKVQKKEGGSSGAQSHPHPQPRKCSHCGVQKTPQWRTGPLGPKTLCNACGVRYKSGRLLPEYRPAISPTFSEKLHSNSHRKVLEMRKVKESKMSMYMGQPGPVPSVLG